MLMDVYTELRIQTQYSRFHLHHFLPPERHQMISDFLINKYPAIFERTLTVVLRVFPDHLSKKRSIFYCFSLLLQYFLEITYVLTLFVKH